MRAMTIDLDDLILAMDCRGVDFYLDLLNGEIRLTSLETPDPELDALLESDPDRLLPIEPLSSADSLELMREFLREVEVPHAYAALANALRSRKPFKAFKHSLTQYPEILQAWYRYQNERVREWALDWLEANDIRPYAGQSAAPALRPTGKTFQ